MTHPDDPELGDALHNASRDVRPVDLWPRLKEPTEQIAAAHARRYRWQVVVRTASWAAAAAAILVITVATFVTLNRARPAGPAQVGVGEGPRVAPAPVAATPTTGPELGKGGVLRYNIGTYPDTLDPHQAAYTNEITVLRLLYEGLTRLDTNLNIVGGAAESWQVADDGLTWTFTLRPGLKYSDGAPLTAQNFEYALKRAASPNLAGQYQASTFDIEGAEAYGAADPKKTAPEKLKELRDKVAVKAVDDRTLQIRTRQPIAYLPSHMSLGIAYPRREDVAKRGGEMWWAKAENHIGNGPFKLDRLEEKTLAVLSPNPYYSRPAHLDRIELRFVTDSKVAFDAYRAGELDMLSLAAEDLDAVLKDPALSQEVVRTSSACTLGFFFNQTRPPFDNRDARLAVAKGIDRAQFVRDVLRGVGTPTTAWIPVGLPDHNPDAGRDLAFDPLAARAAWERAGFQGEVKLSYAATPRNKSRFEFLADQMTSHLGAKVVLDPVEPTTLTAMSKSLATSPLLTLGGWCSDYPDAQNWMSAYWDSKAFAARYGYKNENVDRLQRAADAETDPLRRGQLYQEAEAMVLADVAVAPLYHSENLFLVKPYVKGYTPTAQDHLLGELSITEMTAAR